MQIGNQGIPDGSVTAVKLAAGAAAANITANTLTDSMIQALDRFSLYTANGTFTAPKTGTYLCIGMGGGGGGGGGDGATAGASYGGVGGNGGQGAPITIVAVSLMAGTDYAVTVGQGGAPGNGGAGAIGTSGGTGYTTELGSVFNAFPGLGGEPSAQSSTPNAYGAPGIAGGGNGGGRGATPQYTANSNGDTPANPTAIGAGGGGGGGASAGANQVTGGDGGSGAPGFLLLIW